MSVYQTLAQLYSMFNTSTLTDHMLVSWCNSLKKSVDISSSAPFELGDFIPLVSPEHCNSTEIMATDHGSSGLFEAQRTPSFSKDDDFPKHHLRVKALYSDRTEETKSVFARLEDREKCASMNKRNLLQWRNFHSGNKNQGNSCVK
ncbi:hypothetical protein LIER_04531 [Lithospermum erythrorhizon]|uniref:Uncharacterized protein n=1 Tax=Lithospermum erythrorhizon TaxID=34254 RepID=A0AAV3NX92_LITER